MNNLAITNCISFICAGAAFAYGAYKYIRPKRPLYIQMIVMGVGCIMLGRLYQFLRILTGSSISDRAQLGMLGAAGAFAFFFSANFGQVDSLVDDGSSVFKKYRTAAIIAPVCIALLYLGFVLTDVSLGFKISMGLVCLFIMAASYYHLKHLMIPDVDYGVVRCQRKYNALALAYALLYIPSQIALVTEHEPVTMALDIVMGVISVLIVIAADRGAKQWNR